MWTTVAAAVGPSYAGDVADQLVVGFDLDMTLIDSRRAILASWAALAAETGVPVDLAEVDRRLGAKLEDEIAQWFPANQRDAAVTSYRRHYLSVAAGLTTALPGARAALAAVRQAGEAAVIITAKHVSSAGPSLAVAGLSGDDLFTNVHGAEKAAVLARIGAAAYVGDTPADMQAATAAGVTAVGAPTGSFSAGDLRAAGADVVLGSLHEFPAWYARLRGRR
jgi:phosphoglycolate phosphatase-like HAD superfamily hydrolase